MGAWTRAADTMMNAELTPELRALAQQSFQHQAAGRFAEAAQGYAAVLSRAPGVWSACYNLGLVYQHLARLPEAADMYMRAVQLNPQLAEAYNNLGNVLKALKNEMAAIDAYRRAVDLKPQLSEACYNLATMLQTRGEHTAANDMFRKTLATNPAHLSAWDALYRSLLGLRQVDEAAEVFLAWDRAMPPSPELVTAGLALCRSIGDRALEARYLALALDWPFTEFTPEQFVPVLGMIQYFDVTREQILGCYRRYDGIMASRKPVIIPLLPRRAVDARLRIGYVSADFRRHVMGRWMLEVISRHDRSLVSIFLISTCSPREYDVVTDAFRSHADGFADISELDDLAAAKSIAEADLDILVDLAGHTMAARPGIYVHRPARSIVTHLGYHGCLGLSAVDYKLTDHVADVADAGQFQIEQPFALETCVFPLVRVAPAADYPVPGANPELEGKFVFATFTNELKLSARCLAVWRRVLDALPEAVLLFSPLSPAQHRSIERIMAAGGIEKSRIVFLNVPVQDALWRARYRLVHAVMDTFPYAGGDTTLAALDMGVPVVTLCGLRHSERVGASILSHLNIRELIANSEDEFVEIAVKLARDAAFMAQTRKRIEAAVAETDVDTYTRSLERAYTEIAARKPVDASMSLSAQDFFRQLREAMHRHQAAVDDKERGAVAAIYATLRREQPDYSP
ncbi:MAG: tetratricopeptide repeat protein, partial [Betaproteobacteria bacterium]